MRFLLIVVAILLTGGDAMAFTITSSVFTDGGNFPQKHTCDGMGDVSPPLSWNGAPAGVKSFALISDDPDAPMGTWVHWVVWNIPPTAAGFKESMDKNPALADGTRQGITDFKRSGFGAPCPPSGTHRYYFKLYALDTLLELPPSTTKTQLEAAMKGHILAQTQMMGTYSRKR